MGIGRYYLLKANFDKSIKLINEALNIFELNNNLSGAAKSHSLKSILLFRISDAENGFIHSKKSLELYTLANDTNGQISSLINLSYDYLMNNEPDTAFIYMVKLKRAESRMKETSKYFMYQNFGLYYQHVRDFNASIDAFKKAIVIAKENDMVDSETSCYKSIAGTYLDMKDYKNA